MPAYDAFPQSVPRPAGPGCTTVSRRVTIRVEAPVYDSRHLGRAGIVEAREGRDGGYRLARAPEQITLAAVYRAIHAPGPLPVTPVDASGCGRGHLRAAFDEVMAEAEEAAVAVM